MRRIVITGTTTVALAMGLASPALADVEKRGACTATSTWEVDVDRDGGSIDLSMDIDTATAGERWLLKVTRNGKQIYSMARVSEQDPDEVLADAWWDFVRPSRGSGPEKFTFTARNTVTNERCTTSVRA
jgi:hypothetical protein